MMNPSMNDLRHHLVIFTDGACSGNPGPGGWGAILAYPEGKIVELGGRSSSTTNNKMELLATIEALDAARDFEGSLSLYTDSTYVIRGATQWVYAWKNRGWKTAEGKDVANAHLWKTLLPLLSKFGRRLQWHYVRGHQGTPGNERCDEIARLFTAGRSVSLYRGSLLQYSIPIYDLPTDTSLPEMKPKEEKQVAYSYLSLVNGVLERHSDWKSCEARVKGRPGAKFKKAMSADQEIAILDEWGLPRGSIRD